MQFTIPKSTVHLASPES